MVLAYATIAMVCAMTYIVYRIITTRNSINTYYRHRLQCMLYSFITTVFITVLYIVLQYIATAVSIYHVACNIVTIDPNIILLL